MPMLSTAFLKCLRTVAWDRWCPSSSVNTRPESSQNSPAFNLHSVCTRRCSLSAFITEDAGVSRRVLSFFREPKKYVPPFSLDLRSCCATVTVPASKSTSFHRRPRSSPCRNPVSRSTINSRSNGYPWIAFRKAAVCASSSGLVSARSTRGSLQASEGLIRR